MIAVPFGEMVDVGARSRNVAAREVAVRGHELGSFSRCAGEQPALAAQLDDHTGRVEHDPADVSLQRCTYGDVGNDRDTAGGLTAPSREVEIGEVDRFGDRRRARLVRPFAISMRAIEIGEHLPAAQAGPGVFDELALTRSQPFIE